MLVLDEAHRVKNPEGVYANGIMPLARPPEVEWS